MTKCFALGQHLAWLCGLALVACTGAAAQDRIYRCGNEYTNSPSPALLPTCRLVEGANVTVVQSPRALPAARSSGGGNGAVAASGAASGAVASAGRVSESADQRARDSDARTILEAELKKAEERLADLKRDFNGGEPEKRGEEFRNPQKYLDRTASIKADIARSDSDIAGLKREISRLPGAFAQGGGASGPAAAGLGSSRP